MSYDFHIVAHVILIYVQVHMLINFCDVGSLHALHPETGLNTRHRWTTEQLNAWVEPSEFTKIVPGACASSKLIPRRVAQIRNIGS